MALDATVAGQLADSYLTVAAADAFATASVGRAATAWTAAQTAAKEAALKQATREVDQYLRSSGTRYLSLQRLLYPRAVDAASSIGVVSSSVASPSVITTVGPHGFTTGQLVTLTDHLGSSPALAGPYVITVTGSTTFTVPVNVTTAGAGGTLTNASVALIPYIPTAILSATWAQAKFLNDNPNVRDDRQTREARGVRSGSEPQVSYTLDDDVDLLCDEAKGYLQGIFGRGASVSSVRISTDYAPDRGLGVLAN